MNNTSVLKKQVKKFVDTAAEKEFKLIYNFFDINKEDWWDEIGKEHQKAIKESIAEVDKGKVIPHSEMVKQYKNWLRK